MSGKASHDKGDRGERAVANIFRKNGYKCRRGWQNHSGKNEPDLIVENFPYHVEVKYQESLNIYKSFSQSLLDNPDERANIVIFKKNRQPWRVALMLDEFLRILHGKKNSKKG